MNSTDRAWTRVFKKTTHGFTFTEIVVALAIIAVLTAVIVPGLNLRLRSAQSASIIQDMRSISSGILQYRENVGRYPQSLIMLSSSTAATVDACGNTLPATLSANWRGPYVSQDIASGFVSGDAVIKPSMVRSPINTNPNSTVLDGTLRIDIERVDSLSAESIEAAFDGYTGSLVRFDGGTVRWVPVAGASGMGKIGTLIYTIPVRGC
ncbi:MAG: prepilin-type N-terminal cleavage/methylation domain-containing protein [Gemmatimonadaceae bacterium]|nr:prepilin-type N-terminal cleavage/methylation domain-containing protein [Gemmatimonadaceae bacterium]